MKKDEFIYSFLPLARKAGEAFRLNPAVILAQAAIESGWGQSTLSTDHNNFFGITAYGPKNVWWTGACIELGPHSLSFRIYRDPEASFMDYARLIRNAYPKAAKVSFNPAAFAREISCSKYISEVNGDNREAYRKLLVSIAKKMTIKDYPPIINYSLLIINQQRMDVLKTILSFLTTLAQIIFPRRKRPAAGDCPCPNPLPAPAGLPVPLDAGDGGDVELHRGDSIALEPHLAGNNSALSNLTYAAGCGLMMAGGVGCILRHLL